MERYGSYGCTAYKRNGEYYSDTVLLQCYNFYHLDAEIEGRGKDYVYELIMEIITDHNETIQRFYESMKNVNCLLLPDQPFEIHPNEVTSDSMIISSNDE